VDEEEGCQLSPAGFYLVQLPFSEDIRFNPAPHVAATAETALHQLYHQNSKCLTYMRSLVLIIAIQPPLS
jgi:inner membrane protein involved in colicin E2 resistance